MEVTGTPHFSDNSKEMNIRKTVQVGVWRIWNPLRLLVGLLSVSVTLSGANKLGIWINRYTLLYIKYINSEDLLYSTGDYVQYFVTIYDRK